MNMKIGFVLLLLLSLGFSISIVSKRNRRVALAKSLPRWVESIKQYEKNVARGQNPADPDYPSYKNDVAIYQSILQDSQEALRREQAELDRLRRQRLPITVAALVCWGLWLCSYIFLFRTDRRFVARLNRVILLVLFTISGAVIGALTSFLIAIPFGYGAGGVIVLAVPVLTPLFASIGFWLGWRMTRLLSLRTTVFR
jgi:hypothetical protein